ncbi:hypothetical protein PIB30_077397, partial [Stylosanthes scabra]|nr:hypothetical protein [Stylosanthes scabra]
ELEVDHACRFTMALVVSSQSNFKNELVLITDKLDENNYCFTWQKSVLLTIRTLNLQDYLSFDKAPPQFEEILETETESKAVTNSDAVEAEITKKTPSKGTKVLRELQKYVDWVQNNDCALMTWLDASIAFDVG